MNYDPSVEDCLEPQVQFGDNLVDLHCPVDNVSFGEAAYYANQMSVLHGYDECLDCFDSYNQNTSGNQPSEATVYHKKESRRL